MLSTFMFVGGWLIAAAFFAVAVGFDASGASLVGMSSAELRTLAVISVIVFFGITAWRELELVQRPKPHVVFADYSHVDSHPVTFAVVDTKNRQIVTQEVAPGDFRRIALLNKAIDPSGPASTARNLSARVVVRDANGGIADKWQGRWAMLEEDGSPGKKWLNDRIDLSPNGQEAVLDLVMRYCGTNKMMGWDNTLAAGAGERKELTDPYYEIEVRLGAENLRARSLFFTLTNTVSALELKLKERAPWRERWFGWVRKPINAGRPDGA